MALQKNADDTVDEFYKEDDLINEDGYEMESILPEETENPTPHFEDQTFEILSEEQTVSEPGGIRMELIEKETEEVELEQPVIQPTPKKEKFTLDPDFEIEGVQAFGTIDEDSAIPKEKEHFGLDTNFDPRLELSKYKFPSIDLLEEHGSGQIEINKEELEQNKNQIVQTLLNYNMGIRKNKGDGWPYRYPI